MTAEEYLVQIQESHRLSLQARSTAQEQYERLMQPQNFNVIYGGAPSPSSSSIYNEDYSRMQAQVQRLRESGMSPFDSPDIKLDLIDTLTGIRSECETANVPLDDVDVAIGTIPDHQWEVAICRVPEAAPKNAYVIIVSLGAIGFLQHLAATHLWFCANPGAYEQMDDKGQLPDIFCEPIIAFMRTQYPVFPKLIVDLNFLLLTELVARQALTFLIAHEFAHVLIERHADLYDRFKIGWNIAITNDTDAPELSALRRSNDTNSWLAAARIAKSFAQEVQADSIALDLTLRDLFRSEPDSSTALIAGHLDLDNLALWSAAAAAFTHVAAHIANDAVDLYSTSTSEAMPPDLSFGTFMGIPQSSDPREPDEYVHTTSASHPPTRIRSSMLRFFMKEWVKLNDCPYDIKAIEEYADAVESGLLRLWSHVRIAFQERARLSAP